MQFRRLVTILFVDVVESMALAEALDAEALGRVLQSYFETVSAAITRHGGAVEKYAGDAVMAAFGIPVAHEDDALRAARAALDVRAGLAALNERLASSHGVSLQVRIGLEAGEVVATPTDARQRLVTGEAVGIAAKLEQAAADDEIRVGEVAARLIDHAARLEPLGALEIKGKRDAVQAYRLLELTPVGPAFQSRLDAPLVGRKKELAALRRALKRAVEGGSARAKVVVGPPGAGKSRLVAELSRRTKGVTTLWGRCLSYGEGITYWPLREVLADGTESQERDAVLAALDAETPPPAAEIAWLFRRFCEEAAREQPLVLVFDDVHWAEPTLLELVEHLVGKGEAPVLVVCIARDELLEDRAEFLAEAPNADRIVLDALTADETDALLDGLGGTVLESDQRDRVIATAEGNPFFLEQLLALALEGGLGERQLPETVQALLAARLDRLGPGERAVLERGAVIGKEFRLDDVVALLEPEAAPTSEAHMQSLAARGFVRPGDTRLYRFRHVLVQEAVYRAAPKRLRAELHERFIDRYAGRDDGPADVDELAGYHLERAYTLRTELGESDRRTERLAEDAGRRLGSAGLRAFMRGDMPAAANLFERATSLLPTDEPFRRRLEIEHGLTQYARHDGAAAVRLLEGAMDESQRAGDRHLEARSRMELQYVRLRTEPGRTAKELQAALDAAVGVFQSVGDHRALGRASLLSGWVRGGRLCNHQAWLDGAERALEHYRTASWPSTTCVGEIGAGLYWGSTPVATAITRCEELLRESVTQDARAYAGTFLGGLAAQGGDIEGGRELMHSALATFADLGQRISATTYCYPVLSDVEILAGDLAAAKDVLQELCALLERSGQFSRLSSAASELAYVLAETGSLDDAKLWTEIAEQHMSADDIHARIRWYPVRARIDAEAGDIAAAIGEAREGVRLSETTDDLNSRGKAHVALAALLRLDGQDTEAAVALRSAIDCYGHKGNVVQAGRVRELLEDTALV
jgi:class 3 adenylate cyclase